MTYDVILGAGSAKLVLEKDAFFYTREDGRSIAKSFSIESAGEGRFSVLIEDRSYQVTLTKNNENDTLNKVAQLREAADDHIRGREQEEVEHEQRLAEAPKKLAEAAKPIDQLRWTPSQAWGGNVVMQGEKKLLGFPTDIQPSMLTSR